jgi:small-conductance mechanosensitive channel/CRP-like cAMP-binding protein
MTTLAAWTLMQDGGRIEFSAVMIRLGILLVAYLAFTAAQRWLARSPVLRSISLQLNLLTLMLLVLVFLKPVLLQMNPGVADTILAATAFLGVATGLKLVDILLFDLLAKWRNKPQVPLVIRDIGRWTVAALALVLIVRGFFPGVNLNVLAVSSLVVGYIVGNATQDTLGNLISGLALNTERPFQIGDWVTVGGLTGTVVDTTWRATRLRTKADDYIVIPNSSIAKEAIVNFSRPTRNHGCNLPIGVSYESPPNKVRQVILGVLAECPDVSAEPAPSVYLTGYGDFSINFTIKFFITDYARQDAIQSGVMDRLWYAFRREGISIPFPVQDCRERNALEDERLERSAVRDSIRKLLAGVDLFQSLSPAEMEQLADGAGLQMFAGGEKLCRQGEAGGSFYIIRSGRVEVQVAGADGTPVPVAHLGAGAFFGEMSLLTGEPRSGTVVAETDVEVLCVSKGDFAGVLKANADLAGKLAVILEKRLAERGQRMASLAPAGSAPETHSALVARIRRFFGIG